MLLQWMAEHHGVERAVGLKLLQRDVVGGQRHGQFGGTTHRQGDTPLQSLVQCAPDFAPRCWGAVGFRADGGNEPVEVEFHGPLSVRNRRGHLSLSVRFSAEAG